MFKNPFSFSGRIRRTEYMLSLLIYFTVAGAITTGSIMMMSELQMGGLGFVLPLLYLPLLWFLWAQGAKRCHDRNNTGWFQLIPYYFLWMLFAGGDEGSNHYGEDPKGGAEFETEVYS